MTEPLEPLDHGPAEVEISRGARWPTMIVAAAVVVALGVFFLGRSPAEDAGSTPARDPDATTTTAPSRPTSNPTFGVVGTGEPLLGEQTGILLVIGSTETELRALDLDTGRFTSSGRPLHPHLVEAGWLMARDNWGRWFRSPVAAVDTEPDPAAPQRPFIELVQDAHSEDGLVWGRSPGFDGEFIWHRLDIVSGQVVEVFSAPASSRVPSGPEDVLSGPELVEAAGGGIFRHLGDGEFELVHPGRLVAAGEARALVSVCDAELDCALTWIDSRTAEALPEPTPDIEAGVGYLIADDRLLVVENRARVPTVVVIVETATGRIVRSAGEVAVDDVWLSPDGRWVARRDYGDLRVLDVETGEAINLPGVSVAQGETVLWAQFTEAETDGDRQPPSDAVSPPVPESHPTHR